MVSNWGRVLEVTVKRGLVRGRGYLLCSRECMVETGHISHNGFLIGTSSVHNVYKVGGGGGDRGYEGKQTNLGMTRRLIIHTTKTHIKQANTDTNGGGCRSY